MSDITWVKPSKEHEGWYCSKRSPKGHRWCDCRPIVMVHADSGNARCAACARAEGIVIPGANVPAKKRRYVVKKPLPTSSWHRIIDQKTNVAVALTQTRELALRIAKLLEEEDGT